MPRVLVVCISLLLILASCSPTKRLKEGEYLVNKVKIKGDDVSVNREDLLNVIKQRPNRKIFLLGRFHLHMYNLPDPKKMNLARKKKDQRIRKRNIKRIAKGKKDTLDYKLTSAEWFRQVVGEPPVILDTNLAKDSEDQLSLYLMKKGYFSNKVEFAYKKWDKWPKKKRATLTYTLNVQKPYTIDSIIRNITDKNVDQIIGTRLPQSLVKSGDQFDVSALDEERIRITNILRNNGYYYFVKEYIEFEVDSINKNKKVDLKMNVLNPNSLSAEADSTENNFHIAYSIGEVIINYQLPNTNNLQKDTIITGDYTFIGSNQFPLNTSILTRNIFINSGERYQKSKVEFTYRRLLAFEVISLVNIQFIEDPLDKQVLNAVINISFNKRGNISLETTGTTNSGDNLGVEISTAFKHKNIFNGAEVLSLQLLAGAESQQSLIANPNASQAGTNRFNFNTIEFGPTLSLKIPKITWPFRLFRTSKSSNQSTIFSTAFNYQARDDYKRSSILGGLGFTFWETNKTQLIINPIEINVIKIDKSQAFIDRLNEINDRFLSDSYSDHYVQATNASFVFKKRKISGLRSSIYNKSNVEFAGNLLRGFAKEFGLSQNESGSYLIFDIPFAQYVKVSNDVRLYHNFNTKSTLVYRAFVGVGVPFDNIHVLPFSRSFYGGGANGNRAWKARSLGPGSYFEEVTNYDKIGDIHLETNLEYRFDLLNYLEGAFFIDAGNIWLYNTDSIRVGGEFDINRFASEIAVGVGVGARLNFDYFLVRFDLALQAKDPSLSGGERWIYQGKENYNSKIDEYNLNIGDGGTTLNHYRPTLNFNLGIGYPF